MHTFIQKIDERKNKYLSFHLLMTNSYFWVAIYNYKKNDVFLISPLTYILYEYQMDDKDEHEQTSDKAPTAITKNGDCDW